MFERAIAVPAEAGVQATHPRWRPDRVVMLCVLVTTIGLLWLLPRPLGSDISGQLWIAHHLRQGARLYIDIYEINPPLWFWLAIPIDALAALVRARPEALLIVAVGGLTLAGIAATDRLLAYLPRSRRRGLLVYAVLILLIMPARDFEQREQLALICALPYVALVAARRSARPVGWPLALAVGAGSAIGLALKHYFLGVPLLLELWLLASLRRQWRPLRPETIALAGAGIAYGVAILLITPDYIRTTVPELRLAYGGFDAPSLRALIQMPQLVWLLTLAAIAPQLRSLGRAAPLATALLIAGAGFGAAWLIQHKGWPYQGMATTGMLALAFAALLAEAWERAVPPVRLVAATILLLPLALAAIPTHPAITPAGDIAPALAGLPRGSAIGVISTAGISTWPSTMDRDFRFSSRFGQYWMLRAIDADAAARVHNPALARFARKVVDETVLDYRCLPPARIIILRPEIGGSASTDPLRYFLRDPAFARIFASYRPLGMRGIVDGYERVGQLPALPAAACRHGA